MRGTLTLMAMFLLAAGDALAQTGVEDLGDALEQELLEDLGDDLLDPPAAEPPAATDESQPKSKPQQPAAGEDLGAAGEDENPLIRIGKQMRAVEQLIAEREALAQAPEKQQQIVEELEKLIEQVRKQQSQQGQAGASSRQAGSQRSKVQQPGQQSASSAGRTRSGNARDATERLGKENAREVDMAEMQSLLKDLWGHLPQRTREQMLQSSVEQFLPKYEIMIEKYFRRLAEDQQSAGP